MSAAAWEYEWETVPELEDEADYESEEFFRRLLQSPRLRGWVRRMGNRAQKAAFWGRIASTALHPTEAPPPLPPPYVEQRRRDNYGQYPPDPEWEFEDISPANRVYPAALMEHLGHAAVQAESEAEAEAFIGALVPLAARLLPRAASLVMRNAPRLIRGATQVARTLRSNPTTRPLVRALPTVVRRTAAQMARQAAQGRPINPRTVGQILAQQTGQVIGDPRASVNAYMRSRALDRQYHRMTPSEPDPGSMPDGGPMDDMWNQLEPQE